MKYETINNDLFKLNRKNFTEKLQSNSIAIFHSNDEFPRSGDQHFPFKQNADIFYLSGIDQEKSVLVLFPDCPDPKYREALFLLETNEHIAVWEGHKYTKEEARQVSGIQSVFWLQEYEKLLPLLLHYAEKVYLNSNENDRYVHTVPYRDLRMGRELMAAFPLHHYVRSAPIIRALREIKSTTEVELIRKACNITGKAFRRVLGFVNPGVKEYEIEAEIIHEFIRSRASGHAYHPIIASGASACVLHYGENNKECKDGEVILMDFGAEYGNYNADLTRSIPVNGRFTDRQRAVYNAVLRVMKEAIQLLVPGTVPMEYTKEVGKLMESELLSLGLISRHDVEKQREEAPVYKKYFMHGISHHLGLDVHDIGHRYQKMAPGMVFTCEPGIYIPEEGLGIRLENDILITEDGNIDLMGGFRLKLRR
ncbi:aminopeptidase P family protein [Anseongella ginsenosidimutans]|uniref:aminopeptidase P family protein n=1 Tax=Anseongella ginsenosidimutans TaxID=496056 RepID=UPI001CEFA4DF|nr:aminopeptidase P family protein [Anseongella ginsenosidimutans]